MRHYVLGLAALLLVGVGCQSNPELVLPMTPPPSDTDVMMDDSAGAAGGTMLEGSEMPDNGMIGGDAMPGDSIPGDAKMDDDGVEDNVDMMEEDDAKMDDATSSKKPYYIAYSAAEVDAALAEGRPVMLYFWASWCPICRAEEPKLKEWIDASSTATAGFRVNYDTDKELAKKYGVTYQHTTIILNADGEVTAKYTGPMAQEQLEAELEKAS